MSIPIKRRGRPPSSTHAADEAILNDWQAAQRGGETRERVRLAPFNGYRRPRANYSAGEEAPRKSGA